MENDQYNDIAESGQRLITECQNLINATGNPLNNNNTQNSGINNVSNSLLDNETISVAEATNSTDSVVVNMPLIYISCDEDNGTDQAIKNLRLIKYSVLLEMIATLSEILGNSTDQCALSTKLIGHLSAIYSSDVNSLLDFMTKIANLSQNLDLDDGFYDLTCPNVSFDRIRKYIVDDYTGILVSAEPTTIMGVGLYSQISNNNPQEMADMINQIRVATDDTDFNRMQYYLQVVENLLLFRPGYLCESTAKLGNIALFHLCLVSQSRPLEGNSSNDLRANILSYMIDVIVRSRLTQMWQRDPTASRLLHDMTQNYDKHNHLVQLSLMRSSKERANYIIKSLKNVKDANVHGGLTKYLDYDVYMEALEKFRINIENADYYYLNNEFIVKLGMSSGRSNPSGNIDTTDSDNVGLFEYLYQNTDTLETFLKTT